MTTEWTKEMTECLAMLKAMTPEQAEEVITDICADVPDLYELIREYVEQVEA